MFDFEVAFYFYKLARIQSIFFNSKYKAKAFHAAAMALDSHDIYVTRMYEQQKLRDISYVGEKIEQRIIEIIEQGDLRELREYEKEFGIRDYSILLSSGLSDAIIKKLWHLNIHSVRDIQLFLKNEKLNMEVTNGEKCKLERFVQEYTSQEGKYLYAYGECLGKEIVQYMRGIKGIQAVKFQREESFLEKIQDIKIVYSYMGKMSTLLKKLRCFKRLKGIRIINDSTITCNTQFGMPVKLVCSNQLPIDDYKADVQRNDDLNIEDIRGDLHMHTNWSDGIHSIEQMCEECEARGYEYMAITDHSISMRVAHGLSDSQALSQIAEIRCIEKKCKIKILAGIEVDILKDGSLDYKDEVLEKFDFVVAAIHSNMEQSPYEMESRLQRALSNPYVNVLAHPTGRLLGRPGIYFSSRKAYIQDVSYIIRLCSFYHVALEINCFPERLDLDTAGAVLAAEQGVKLTLGTDSHSLAHLRNIEYAVKMLKGSGISKSMILNTYSFDELLNYFQGQKENVKFVEPHNDELSVDYGKKDFTYYFGTNESIISGEKSVIGIDLTGSEDKESGWAFMCGKYTQCRRIGTDSELIESIIRINPTIVSIDSPLAYPKGRCCARKECDCSKYGIMRESERLLRHFGITVYPCLIDSMVNLTTRGMRLASILRKMGYTVIESYPGVAQDVLHIPRKGKTHEQFAHLKQGLASFGIEGDLIDKEDISHDEVDAITSALVGYFYLNNQYIGLGNDAEDYLIVPRIQDELLHKRVVIGLCGETSAGKTTVAEYLRFKYGLKYFRYSQVIEDKYDVHDKQELQSVGVRISQNEEEQRELTKYMVRKMDETSSYVIDGLRHVLDYQELKNSFKQEFIFIYIDCKYGVRCKRYKKMFDNEISDEKFREINNHKSEQEIAFVQMKADYLVDNNKGYKDLWEQIDEIIKKESRG